MTLLRRFAVSLLVVLLAVAAVDAGAVCSVDPANDLCSLVGCICDALAATCANIDLSSQTLLATCLRELTFEGTTTFARSTVFRAYDGNHVRFHFKTTHSTLDASGFTFEDMAGGRVILYFSQLQAIELTVPTHPVADNKLEALVINYNPVLKTIHGSVGYSGSSVPYLAFTDNTALESISANFLRTFDAQVKFQVHNNHGSFELPSGFFYGATVDSSSSYMDIPASSPSVLHDIPDEACDGSCTSSCVGTTTGCCHSSCRTCSAANDATACLTCHASDVLVGGECGFAPPFNEAEFDSTKLAGTFRGGYIPSTVSCFIDVDGSKFFGGFAVDNKFCCRRKGTVTTGGTLCETDCASRTYADFVHTTASPADGDECWARCYEL